MQRPIGLSTGCSGRLNRKLQKKESRAHAVQERKKGIDKRAKLNAADNVARMKQPTVSGATPWEKVTSVVDFTF